MLSITVTNIVDELLSYFLQDVDNYELFVKFYETRYPWLWQKQFSNCQRIGLNIKRCINEISNHLAISPKTFNNISRICLEESDEVKNSVVNKYNDCFDANVKVYIYIDLNCGAGWATQSKQTYLVLIGVKSLIDLGFNTRNTIKKILFHEFGHIVSWMYRNKIEEIESLEQKDYDPIYMLYSEGLAQRIAYDFLKSNCWFQPKKWYYWCERNFENLAQEYFQRMLNNRSVDDFFNIMLSYKDKTQTGYFIGLKFINYLENKYSIEEITKLELSDVEKHIFNFLLKNSQHRRKHGVCGSLRSTKCLSELRKHRYR